MASTAEKIIPLVSSGTAGPLGVKHLPRLWLKLTLDSAGRLAEGYDFCGKGFDQMTLDALGLKRDEVIAFVKQKKPTYTQFEAWVVQKAGGSISAEAIKRHNDAITGYNHAPDLAASMRSESGVSNASLSDAVSLNMLEDLDTLHRSL
jgi:hypothetical protein